MYIASQLKNSNICEYLLYMWQVEDIIRAFDFDINKITESFISRLPIYDDIEMRTITQWYESLIEMMHREGIAEKGHLQLNRNLIAELNEFHHLIYNSGQAPDYNAKYLHVLPIINQFRNRSEEGLTDIELCFNFQYGFLMLRLKKADINAETVKSQKEISKFMSLLAVNYHAFKNGELDL